MIYYIIIIILIIIILILCTNKKKDTFINNIDHKDHKNGVDMNVLAKCNVPNLNSDQCYKSRYYECPIVNGTYLQCTNNYIPLPKEYNADCANRTFEMVTYPWKISENCYYNNIGFNRAKKFDKVTYS
jgi:short subunit fatty acids transporter